MTPTPTADAAPEGFGTLIAQALATPNDEPPSDRTAQRILDATVTEIGAQGMRAFSMEGVARRAGVNRVTVYRRFGDRDALLAALGTREALRYAEGIAQAIAGVEDRRARVAEGFIAAVQLARRHPVIARTATYEPDQLIAAGLANNAAFLRFGSDIMATAIREAQQEGHATDLNPDLAGETAARLLASIILLPGGAIDPDNAAEFRRYVWSIVVPMALGPLSG